MRPARDRRHMAKTEFRSPPFARESQSPITYKESHFNNLPTSNHYKVQTGGNQPQFSPYFFRDLLRYTAYYDRFHLRTSPPKNAKIYTSAEERHLGPEE